MMIEHADRKDLDEELFEVANYIAETNLIDNVDDDCDEFDTWIKNLPNLSENEPQNSNYIKESISELTNV